MMKHPTVLFAAVSLILAASASLPGCGTYERDTRRIDDSSFRHYHPHFGYHRHEKPYADRTQANSTENEIIHFHRPHKLHRHD